MNTGATMNARVHDVLVTQAALEVEVVGLWAMQKIAKHNHKSTKIPLPKSYTPRQYAMQMMCRDDACVIQFH